MSSKKQTNKQNKLSWGRSLKIYTTVIGAPKKQSKANQPTKKPINQTNKPNPNNSHIKIGLYF